MEIKRDIFKDLLVWKNNPDRRPLIIQGARQIGKTWVMRHFGKEHYRNVAYFNFDSNEELAKEFVDTKDTARIISRLRLYCDVDISSNDTLIIFDEIQECPEALNSLKYFCEDAPQYHIIAAGSLLGVAIHHHKGFPVGKVDFLRMYPVTFKEYLATSQPKIAEYINCLDSIEQLPAVIDGKMWDSYNAYRICGGMPKAAVASLEGLGTAAIVREQEAILTSFFLDFTKHAPTSDFPRISAVWQSLPSQLSKENRKFIYKVVRPGARAREYEGALDWLREAGLIYRVYCCTRPGLPLSAYDDISAFKIYMFDTGLLRALAKVPPEIFNANADYIREFRGALTENMVLQALLPILDQSPRYWVSNGTAEVDFIIQDKLEVIPAEVKSALNTSSKSLGVYITKYDPAIALVYSALPLGIIEDKNGLKLLHIPLPLADWTMQLIGLADRQPKSSASTDS